MCCLRCLTTSSHRCWTRFCWTTAGVLSRLRENPKCSARWPPSSRRWRAASLRRCRRSSTTCSSARSIWSTRTSRTFRSIESTSITCSRRVYPTIIFFFFSVFTRKSCLTIDKLIKSQGTNNATVLYQLSRRKIGQFCRTWNPRDVKRNLADGTYSESCLKMLITLTEFLSSIKWESIFFPIPGREQRMLQRFLEHPRTAVQAGDGCHHLGLQTYNAERGRLRFAGLSSSKETYASLLFCGLFMCFFFSFQILQQLLMNMSNFTGAQAFYQAYFMDILQHLFSVVTDTSHTASKSSQVLTS